MAGAPYTINVAFDDSATFELNFQWMVQGIVFPFADYRIEYCLSRASCGPLFTLSSANGGGITTDAVGGIVSMSNSAVKLNCGRYTHACRVTHLASGKVIPVFDGTVTVSEDAFA